MIIKEGDRMKFGYGLVGITPEYYMGVEVLPIPFNFIKRFWYWTVRKTKLSNIDKEIADKQEKFWKEGYDAGKKSADAELVNIRMEYEVIVRKVNQLEELVKEKVQ